MIKWQQSVAIKHRNIYIDSDRSDLIQEKSGLSNILQGSNPCLSAHEEENNGLYGPASDVFFESDQKKWHQEVAKNLIHPFKLSKIVHHDHDLSKRWYVIFYAWDVSKHRLRRRRLFAGINKKKTVRARLEEAEYIVRVVDADLRAGKVLGKDSVKYLVSDKILTMRVSQALQFVSDEKKATDHRRTYYHGFITLKNHWDAYLEHYKENDYLLRQLSANDMFAFFSWLKKEKNAANKTCNNYKNAFSIAINFLMQREPRLFKVNPVNVIRLLPVVVKKHAAFSNKQIERIKEKCIELEDEQLLLFIQFMYYTLARPNEITRLKIAHIDLDLSRIFIPGEISKTKFDDYVGISNHFKNVIIDSGIMNYSGENFIFGREHTPGLRPYTSRMSLWKRNKAILDATKLSEVNKNFSVYSYKHSGAISLYTATKDIKLVQRQCRHKTLNQTNDYLRDLGLVSGLEGLSQWEGAV